MYRWFWPDGFVGDDFASKRNAWWLMYALIASSLLVGIPLLWIVAVYITILEQRLSTVEKTHV